MNAARRIVKYLKETLTFGILFPKSAKQSDAVNGDQVDRRSTPVIFKFVRAPIYWCSIRGRRKKTDNCFCCYLDNKQLLALQVCYHT
jgi:hypothetical protein